MRALIFLLTFVPSAAAAQIMLGQPKAIDGDTFVFGDDMVRIHGIDAVEASQTCDRDGAVWECGAEAIKLLRELLGRGRLRCQQMDLDQYGRQVSTCTAGGRDIGLELVSAGLAIALTQYSEAYIMAEERARARGVGIWGGRFQTPADFRATNTEFSEPQPKRRARPNSAQSFEPIDPRSRNNNVYYRNCNAARAAGAAPIRRGEPGYRPPLDADNDGIACEPYLQGR